MQEQYCAESTVRPEGDLHASGECMKKRVAWIELCLDRLKWWSQVREEAYEATHREGSEQRAG